MRLLSGPTARCHVDNINPSLILLEAQCSHIVMSHARRVTPQQIVEEHRENPGRRTPDMSEFDGDYQSWYMSDTKIGIAVPRTRYQLAGVVGWWDLDSWDPRDRPPLHRCGSSRDTISPYKSFIERVSVSSRESDGLRFPRSNLGDFDNNSYYSRPDFVESQTPDRVDAPDGQAGLDVFEDVSPCTDGVRSCSCCRCPECGIKSIRYRSSPDIQPDYACQSQRCDAEFKQPSMISPIAK